MNDIIDYITNNWGSILAVITSVMVTARIVVKLTPTPKDDNWYAKIVQVLKHLGLVIPDEPKK